MEAWLFFKKTVRMVFVGTKALLPLVRLFTCHHRWSRVTFYVNQLDAGLIVTNMRDQVSWGLYIGNFTYLVGVAAAAVLLVIPAYIYHFDPIKEIVVLGELLAASAIIMALMFVLADLGRPDRFWHLIPRHRKSLLSRFTSGLGCARAQRLSGAQHHRSDLYV